MGNYEYWFVESFLFVSFELAGKISSLCAYLLFVEIVRVLGAGEVWNGADLVLLFVGRWILEHIFNNGMMNKRKIEKDDLNQLIKSD